MFQVLTTSKRSLNAVCCVQVASLQAAVDRGLPPAPATSHDTEGPAQPLTTPAAERFSSPGTSTQLEPVPSAVTPPRKQTLMPPTLQNTTTASSTSTRSHQHTAAEEEAESGTSQRLKTLQQTPPTPDDGAAHVNNNTHPTPFRPRTAAADTIQQPSPPNPTLDATVDQTAPQASAATTNTPTETTDVHSKVQKGIVGSALDDKSLSATSLCAEKHVHDRSRDGGALEGGKPGSLQQSRAGVAPVSGPQGDRAGLLGLPFDTATATHLPWEKAASGRAAVEQLLHMVTGPLFHPGGLLHDPVIMTQRDVMAYSLHQVVASPPHAASPHTSNEPSQAPVDHTTTTHAQGATEPGKDTALAAAKGSDSDRAPPVTTRMFPEAKSPGLDHAQSGGEKTKAVASADASPQKDSSHGGEVEADATSPIRGASASGACRGVESVGKLASGARQDGQPARRSISAAAEAGEYEGTADAESPLGTQSAPSPLSPPMEASSPEARSQVTMTVKPAPESPAVEHISVAASTPESTPLGGAKSAIGAAKPTGTAARANASAKPSSSTPVSGVSDIVRIKYDALEAADATDSGDASDDELQARLEEKYGITPSQLALLSYASSARLSRATRASWSRYGPPSRDSDSARRS